LYYGWSRGYDAHSSTVSGVYCPVGCGVGEFEESAGEDDEAADCERDPILHWRKAERRRSERQKLGSEVKGGGKGERGTSILTTIIYPNKI
jgi:hypothetical protein